MLLLILKQVFSFCYYDGVFPSNSEKELLVRVSFQFWHHLACELVPWEVSE